MRFLLIGILSAALFATIRFEKEYERFVSSPEYKPHEVKLGNWTSIRDFPFLVNLVPAPQPGEINIRLDFRPSSTDGYPNLFQTADVNEGVRMEITGTPPNATAALIWKKGAGQFGSILLTQNLTVGSWHKFSLSAKGAHGIECSMDGQLLKSTDPVSFRVDAIKIGQGFSNERKFKGEVKDAAVGLVDDQPRFIGTLVVPLVTLVLFMALAKTLRVDFKARLKTVHYSSNPASLEESSHDIWFLWFIGIAAVFAGTVSELIFPSFGVSPSDVLRIGLISTNIANAVLFVCAGYEFAKAFLSKRSEYPASARIMRFYSYLIDLGLPLLALDTVVTIVDELQTGDGRNLRSANLELWPLQYLSLFWIALVLGELGISHLSRSKVLRSWVIVLFGVIFVKLLLSVIPSAWQLVNWQRLTVSSDLILLGLFTGKIATAEGRLVKALRAPKIAGFVLVLLITASAVLASRIYLLSDDLSVLSSTNKRLVSVFAGVLVAMAVVATKLRPPITLTLLRDRRWTPFPRLVVEHRYSAYLGLLTFFLFVRAIWSPTGSHWLGVLELATIAVAGFYSAICLRELSFAWLSGQNMSVPPGAS